MRLIKIVLIILFELAAADTTPHVPSLPP